MARPSVRRPVKRSPREWALRGGLAAAALVLGYVSTTQTLAFAISGTDIDRAYALAAGDGRIAGSYAERQILSAGGRDLWIERIARNALLDEPIASPALTALAIQAQLRGDIGSARSLLVHSDALSRRDFGTRLLLLEDAVARENISGALYHYDVALRTSRGASDTLFPVLLAVLDDPAIVPALADLLEKQPPWGEPFMRYALTSSADLSGLAGLFDALIDRRLRIPSDVTATLVDTLATKGAVADAWSFYGRIRASADRRRSRDPRFSALLAEPMLFDWTPVMNDAGITASIQRTAEGGVFEFAAPPTVGGTVLQQMQYLPIGRYRLRGRTAGIDQLPAARPYWAMVCTDAREISRIELDETGRFDGTLSVDRDCPAQLLRLVARPSSAVDGVSGRVLQATLQFVGRGR